MEFRILDSRAAAQSKISKTTNRTLIEDLEEYCDGWIVADGQRTEVGYTRMNDKFTAGKLKIAKSCVNTITCLMMLTGHDGQKGACKDLVDLVRYAVMSDIWGWTVSRGGAERQRAQRSSLTGFTGLTGLRGLPSDPKNPVNLVNPVQNKSVRQTESTDRFRARKSRIWW